MAESDPGFLTRWARRKHEARSDSSAEAPAEPDAEVAAPAQDSEPVPDSAAVPNEADIVASLPDIESLEAGSDFSQFMRPGVPDELRRLALRRLWRVNPVIGVRDGLNEYDEDFRLAGSLVGTVRTVWQAGKGMAGHEPGIAEGGGAAPPRDAAGDETAQSGLAQSGLARGETAASETPEPPAEQTAEASETSEEAEASESGDERSIAAAEERPSAAVRGREPVRPQRSARDRRWGAFRT
jgi:hypothetical protein